ncbi:E3 ubiquitin-protein ligase ATL41-like [Magnolia sinica]|uniref:E3 ubiquitin-protein ligase ATL41-like n=1 Tax=Magnolia sinica TaxID=86752 RepID=UPI002658FDB3|nr:E3 ubiquitin-protein ligase ATL41-like [Magnolia sinica]
MSGDNHWTFSFNDDYQERRSYGVNGRIMLIAVISLFFVVVIVIILHIYARCIIRRQARRRAMIRQLNMAIADAHRQSQEPPKTGLEPSVITTLPIFTYKQADRIDDVGVECTVCLSALEEGEIARILPNCKHMFHVQCIDMWLHSHSTCPICRTGAEPRPQHVNREPAAFAGASAPPLDLLNRTASMASEGTSNAAAQSSKMGGSGSRLSSFRRMLSWERSERRMQSCGQSDAVEDPERQ